MTAASSSRPPYHPAQAVAGVHTRLFGAASGMAMRMGQTHWEGTELGLPDRWSHALRTALGLCLGSRLCSCIYWGEQHLVLYNDADRKSTRLNSSHIQKSRMPSSA